MANIAQLVNVIAPMMVTNDELWMQTMYYLLQLFSFNCMGQSLEIYTDGPYKMQGIIRKFLTWMYHLYTTTKPAN